MSGITAAPNANPPFAQIPGALGKLNQARDEQQRFRIWFGLAWFFLGALGICALFLLIDWVWVAPAWVRALALPALIALAVLIVLRSRRPYSSPQAAVDAEKHFPTLGQRLRTLLQYADPASTSTPVPASPGLLRALAHQTDKRTAALDFRKLVPWPRFERTAIALFLATIVALVALFASPSLRTAALRMLLVPAHYTTMRVEPGDGTLKAGETLKLAVTLDGRAVKSAHWFKRTKNGGGWIAHSLAPLTEPGESAKPLVGLLTANVEDCQEDFEYRVVAGEVQSSVFQVNVVHPLLLTTVQATVTPPAYTRQPSVVLKEGNWNAIEGSRVEIEIALDRSPAAAELTLSTAGRALPEKVRLRIEGTKLSGVIASVTKDVELEITARASDGMALEPEKRRIKVAADREPTLRFVQPEEALAVIPTTEVPTRVEARDDFGVTALGINFKIGDGPEETLHLARFTEKPLTAAALETLYLEKHSLDFKGAITYYAFVEDNYSPKPHRVVSDLRFIDILPFKQDYEFAEGEGSGSCNGGSVSLEELIARQRDNLNRTCALERASGVDDAAAKRLARYQGELQAATAEFAQGIAAIAGPVPALEKAVEEMKSAATALESKDAATARPREEAALTGLIAARQNLRKMLKQSSSSSASACRKFDRQQSQKLRRPPATENKKQLAALEKDLRELAKREERFSEQIEPNGSGGPQVEPPEADNAAPKSSAKATTKSSPQGSKSGSSPGQSTGEQSAGAAGLAEQQRQAAGEAERLDKLAQEDEAATADARRRASQAAGDVSSSSSAMGENRTAEAARKARDAARRLKTLARQVGALHAKELSEQLAREREFAQEIARAQRELAGALEKQAASGQTNPDAGRLSDRQRELAEDTAAVADVLDQIKAAARLDDRELAQAIDQAESTSPPRDVERAMRQNALAIGAGKTATAAVDGAAAAQRLEALVHDLEGARRAAAGPELERLLAAEKEAAALQERLRTVRQASQQAGAERAFEDLAGRLDRLAPGEGALRQAAENMTNAGRTGNGTWTHGDKTQDGEASYSVPPTVYTQTIAAAIAALQAKIQEMVLENSLVERNGPVPPLYKKLVDDYYRVLSQDLR
jgi:Domain of unknown function (DUF4175)